MLKLNKETNPLDLIPDLIEVLDTVLKQDYLIAGGFVRDWYQDESFNDVDIYLFRQDCEALKKVLERTKRFSIVKEDGLFLDAIFHEQGSFFSRGRPKYNVQFISWYKDPRRVLDSFDFDHCKFFIPMDRKGETKNYFEEFIPRIPYAYDRAVEALKNKELWFSSHTKETLNNLSDKTSPALAILEKHIKRTKKFLERGFSLPDETRAILLVSAEKYFTVHKIGKHKSHRKSVLMEDTDYVLVEKESKYSEISIAKNIIKELIMLHSEAERAIFFISPSSFVREVAKEFTERGIHFDPKEISISQVQDEFDF